MIKPINITDIIFDWGGVCCSGADQFSAPVLLKYFNLPALEINAKAMDIENDFIEGKISKKEFWDRVIERLGVQHITNHEELRQHYFNSYVIYPEVLDLAKELKTDYKVSLLSNLNEEMGPHIEKEHKIREIFNPIIFSYEAGLRKPNREIYELTIERLNCNPYEAVFIDDSQKNIEVANELSIIGIRFTNYLHLIRDLKQLGIKVE